MLAAITWLIDENQRADSAYALQLDESRIGVGGHSFGSNSAMSASKDPRVKAFIHTAGSGFRGAGKALNLMQPSAFICGEDDPTANVTDCRTDSCRPRARVIHHHRRRRPPDYGSRGAAVGGPWLRCTSATKVNEDMFVGASCDFARECSQRKAELG